MNASDSGATPLPPAKFRLLLASLLAVSFLGALDHTVVSTSLATIAGELGALEHMSWVVVGYTLASTVLLPVLGRLGDQIGPRLVFISALTIFILASLLCGLVAEMPQLVAARVLQGMSAAGLQLMSQTIVANVTTPRQRPKYLSLIGAAFPVAILIGPLIGGLITDHWGWPWVFWINVPVGLVALALALAAIPKIAAGPRRPFDGWGAVTFTIVLVSIVFTITWVAEETTRWLALPTIALSIVAALIFTYVERRVSNPLVPIALFRNRTFAASVALSGIFGLGLISVTAYLPTYVQMVYGTTATVSGLVPIATVLGMLVSNVTSGWLASRTGRYKVFPLVGTALSCLGLLGMGLLPAGLPLWVPMVFMAFVGLGTGAFMSLVLAIAQSTAPRQQLGATTATAGLAGQVGSSVGTALVGGIVAFGLSVVMPSYLDLANLTPAVVHAASPGVQFTVAQAYHDVFSLVFLGLSAIYLVGFFIALTLPGGRLSDEQPVVDSADAAMPAIQDAPIQHRHGKSHAIEPKV